MSKGFANLFTLGKADLEETLKHYPDAKRILNAKVSLYCGVSHCCWSGSEDDEGERGENGEGGAGEEKEGGGEH